MRKTFPALLLFLGAIASCPAQSTDDPANTDAAAPSFAEFVEHFPAVKLPFEVHAGEMDLEQFPLLSADPRLHNYGACYDYRALGRVELNEEYVYLITYHWCDSLSPTPFYNLLIFDHSGELKSTKPVSTQTDFSRNWSVFTTEGALETYQKAHARKKIQQHTYVFDKVAWGKMVFCSDGWCTGAKK